MNWFYNTIKFTFIWSYRYVNFQRVSILLDDGLISTDLYSKPTDKHQHLFHTSCHPNSCKMDIPFGQALRIHQYAQQMPFLISPHGNYVAIWLAEVIRRIPREDTLRDKLPCNNKWITFVVSFHPALSNIVKILQRLHPVLQSCRPCQVAFYRILRSCCDPETRGIFPELPLVSYQHDKNLWYSLVHSTSGSQRPFDAGSFPCRHLHCQTCQHIMPQTVLHGTQKLTPFIIASTVSSIMWCTASLATVVPACTSVRPEGTYGNASVSTCAAFTTGLLGFP